MLACSQKLTRAAAPCACTRGFSLSSIMVSRAGMTCGDQIGVPQVQSASRTRGLLCPLPTFLFLSLSLSLTHSLSPTPSSVYSLRATAACRSVPRSTGTPPRPRLYKKGNTQTSKEDSLSHHSTGNAAAAARSVRQSSSRPFQRCSGGNCECGMFRHSAFRKQPPFTPRGTPHLCAMSLHTRASTSAYRCVEHCLEALLVFFAGLPIER